MDFEMLHILKIKFSTICNKKTMKSKKEQCTCPTCDTLISETVANCSTCKKWFHAVCEEATESDLNKKQWHCKLCYSNLSINKKK
jgi:hypothetical protein